MKLSSTNLSLAFVGTTVTVVPMAMVAVNADPVFEQTTLEQAFVRAMEAKTVDGTWARLFLGESGDVMQSSQCTGNPDAWPVPPNDDPNTDLGTVLDRGVFRCGYVNNLFHATFPSGQVLIDSTTRDADASGTEQQQQQQQQQQPQPTGAIVDWWNELASEVGRVHDRPDLRVEWVLADTSQEILDGVYYREIDAACGDWSPDGVWLDPDGDFVARALGFAVSHCATFLEENISFVRADLEITSFRELLAALAFDPTTSGTQSRLSDRELTVCTGSSPGGGTEQSCTNIFGQYIPRLQCKGLANEAPAAFDAGECDVLYGHGGSEEITTNYTTIMNPVVYSASTMFRYNNENVLRLQDEGFAYEVVDHDHPVATTTMEDDDGKEEVEDGSSAYRLSPTKILLTITSGIAIYAATL